MPHFIDVVVKVAPEGLADATPSGRVIVGGSTSTFRLDQFVNGELGRTPLSSRAHHAVSSSVFPRKRSANPKVVL